MVYTSGQFERPASGNARYDLNNWYYQLQPQPLSDFASEEEEDNDIYMLPDYPAPSTFTDNIEDYRAQLSQNPFYDQYKGGNLESHSQHMQPRISNLVDPNSTTEPKYQAEHTGKLFTQRGWDVGQKELPSFQYFVEQMVKKPRPAEATSWVVG